MSLMLGGKKQSNLLASLQENPYIIARTPAILIMYNWLLVTERE